MEDVAEDAEEAGLITLRVSLSRIAGSPFYCCFITYLRIRGVGSMSTSLGVENGARRSTKSISSRAGELRKNLVIGRSIQMRSE